MENLKIIINKDKSIAKEAKKLFKELEYYVSSNLHDNKYGWVIGQTSGDYINDISWFDKCHAKLITIQQLRDLVVLKRNNVSDATHENNSGQKMYEAISGDWYLYFNNKWKIDGVDIDDMPKPIEKEMKMKEYLDKDYVLRSVKQTAGDNRVPDGWIKVPEGAEALNSFGVFYKDDGYQFFYEGKWNNGTSKYGNLSLKWQRSETGNTAQSAWDKQTGGDHYKKLAIQPMEYALKNKLDYAQANVVKYVTRHADKNGKEDLLKAIHNIELIIEHYYS